MAHALSEAEPMSVRRSRWLPTFATVLVAALVAYACLALLGSAASALDAPAPVASSRALATDLLGPRIARYVGFCPEPLIVYFVATVFARVPVFLVAGALTRRACRRAASRGRVTALGALATTALVWAMLCVGGAWAVAVATGADERGVRWAFEIGHVAALAGLPSLAIAMAAALVLRRSIGFWLVTPTLLLLVTLLSFGLRGEQLPAGLPGIVELGLLSGVESWRQRAMAGALTWLIAGALVVGALGPRTRVVPPKASSAAPL